MQRSSQSGNTQSSSTSSGQELLCRIKYQNNLPDIPFDPKFISYPFDSNRFVKYNLTSLEKNYKWDLLTEQDLGVRIDLISQDYTKAPEFDMPLDQADEKLLEEDTATPADLKRSEQHQKNVSWMRRNEYISTENTRFQPKQYDSAESKVGYSTKRKIKEVDFYKDRDSQLAAIEKSFEASKKPIERHYSKPNVYPVQEMQIFPDFDLWRNSCAQVIFDDDPAPKEHSASTQNEEMSQAIIKGMIDKTNEQFVAYFLPTEESMDKRRRDEVNQVDFDPEDTYDYKLAREYTWNIKTKSTSGYEENYYFVLKDNCVFYNALDTRVRLNKRRTNTGKVGNTRLSTKFRQLNRQELKIQRIRLKNLEQDNGEDEEVDEDDEEQAKESSQTPNDFEEGHNETDKEETEEDVETEVEANNQHETEETENDEDKVDETEED